MTTVCLLSSQTVVVKKKTTKKPVNNIEKLKKIPTFFLLFFRLSRKPFTFFLVFAPVKNVSCNVYRPPPLCPEGKKFFHQDINTQLPN